MEFLKLNNYEPLKEHSTRELTGLWVLRLFKDAVSAQMLNRSEISHLYPTYLITMICRIQITQSTKAAKWQTC
jgi:hypothetical protein